MDLETLIRQSKPEYVQTDSDKVTSAILERINELPRNQKRRGNVRVAVILAAVIAMMLSALTVNAASGGKLFGAILLNKDNRHIANEPDYASIQEETSEVSGINTTDKSQLSSDIINNKQLSSINASSITNIKLNEKRDKYLIPKILFMNNADLVIFTQKDESGWYLKKGEKLSIRFTLDLKTSKYSDPTGEWMEIGYIVNGEPITIETKKKKDFSTTITANETGTYYFYAENYSAGKLIIDSGIIE